MTSVAVENPQPESLEQEIAELARLLKPRQFRARLALWTKGGIVGGLPEALVKSSRVAKDPKLDRMDRQIELAGERYDSYVADAHAARSQGDLRKARRLLQSAVAVQETWLYPIEVATEAMQAMVSDHPKCKNCPENTPRLRGGRCHACDQYFKLHDGKERPEELWSKPKRKRAS